MTVIPVNSFQDLKLISDPHRLAILRRLMRSTATLSQLGDSLGMSAARVRHHLKLLQAAGMVELVRVQPVRGFLEKYYRATARAYLINTAVLPQPSRHGTIYLLGSHDPALELLADQLGENESIPDLVTLPVGSLEGLMALRQGICQLTGCHLFDPAAGEYNTPYVRHFFPGQLMHIITLAFRQQGLVVSPGNPLHIKGLEDLASENITFINRKRGSGTRLWLDQQLGKLGMDVNLIQGYDQEVNTHSQVAGAISMGSASVGLAVLAVARKANLDFIPLFEERFDLVIPEEQYQSALLIPALEYLHTSRFRSVVQRLGGYDVKATGEEIRLT